MAVEKYGAEREPYNKTFLVRHWEEKCASACDSLLAFLGLVQWFRWKMMAAWNLEVVLEM